MFFFSKTLYWSLCPQTTPSRFPRHCTYKLHYRNSYSSIFDACLPVLREGNYLPWLLRFPLCYTGDPSIIPGICLEIRRCSCWLLLSPSRNIVPQHSFPLQRGLHGSFFLRYFFQLAIPPGFHVSNIPKGNLVKYLVLGIYADETMEAAAHRVCVWRIKEKNVFWSIQHSTYNSQSSMETLFFVACLVTG